MFRCFVADGRTNEVSIPFCRAVELHGPTVDYARQEHKIGRSIDITSYREIIITILKNLKI